MKFFDYLYYHIYKFYSRKEKGAATSSSSIIGGLQAMNILTIFMVPSLFITGESYLKYLTFIALGLGLLFIILNYVRYINRETPSISMIKERWQSLDDNAKVRARAFELLYVVVSVGLFFGVAIFLGWKRNHEF